MGVIETIKRQEREKGIQSGIEKGKREESIAIALEFKKMGLPSTRLKNWNKSNRSSLPRDNGTAGIEISTRWYFSFNFFILETKNKKILQKTSIILQ